MYTYITRAVVMLIPHLCVCNLVSSGTLIHFCDNLTYLVGVIITIMYTVRVIIKKLYSRCDAEHRECGRQCSSAYYAQLALQSVIVWSRWHRGQLGRHATNQLDLLRLDLGEIGVSLRRNFGRTECDIQMSPRLFGTKTVNHHTARNCDTPLQSGDMACNMRCLQFIPSDIACETS